MSGAPAVRHEGRGDGDLRPIRIQRKFTGGSAGSVLIQAGRTTVLCTASVEESVPPWKARELDPTGWVTAEYSMLPGSTSPRKKRERGQIDGRSSEIQRLIGRSLRSVVDMAALGQRTITVDCDVLEADGGTRTLSITGGFIALVDAIASVRASLDPSRPVLTTNVAAVSVGVFGGRVLVDLDYSEDSRAEVDMNVVMTGKGEFVEVQGTAEAGTFGRPVLNAQLDAAEAAVRRLMTLQREALGSDWPWP
ncbi:MAG: ribonuclease PH [Planctomycetaceae bacterium]